ncbi:MAG: zinc ribbon domain-containing protein [Acidimicrobiales bacterium]
MSANLASLMDLQDVDTLLDQLKHKREVLPERRSLADAMSVARSLDRQLADLTSQRDALVARQAELEAEIESATARVVMIERRLYGGEVSASRELQAMSEEVDHLRSRRATLEDSELALMEETEPLDAEISKVSQLRSDVDAEIARISEALAVAEAGVDAQITEREGERHRLAEAMPQALLAEYERLRSRLGGEGAARLVGDSCTGCHLRMPATEVERIRRLPPGSFANCEQCGRIIVH